jgi:membrane-bound lytic murein transglycosylase F
MNLRWSGFRLQQFFCICILLLLMMPVFFLSCESGEETTHQKLQALQTIQQNKRLTVITRNNSHCYYSYRDQEMGFEYDLFKAFADDLGVDLNIIIAEKWERMIPDLMNGAGDLIAASMTITPSRSRQVAFSNGYLDITQHLIVHRNNTSIRQLKDLSGQSIHVRKGTSYQERLERLKKDQPELNFKIILHEDVPTEELIRQVSEKEIEITIADSNIAMLNRRYYPHAIMAGSINETEKLGWAVRPESKNLMTHINLFFEKIKHNGEFSEIYNRYYANVDQFDFVDLRKFHRQLRSRLQIYKKHIMEASEKYGFDWRLIAAQMYQESHFDPNARSNAGAYGLMQLTKRTADGFGVTDLSNPQQNIFAGVNHLKYLFDYFDIDNDSDRLKISLAAYNTGQGHVRDAQKLAVQLRRDPEKWDSIKKTLPLLRYRQYFQNATYGYCRGTEPVKYVRQIMIYYDILKRQAIEYHKDMRDASLPDSS